MAFIEATVGGNKQLLNVDAIEQVSPGPDSQSSIYLNGGEQRTMIQPSKALSRSARHF